MGSYQAFLVSYRIFIWKGYVFEKVFWEWQSAYQMLEYIAKD